MMDDGALCDRKRAHWHPALESSTQLTQHSHTQPTYTRPATSMWNDYCMHELQLTNCSHVSLNCALLHPARTAHMGLRKTTEHSPLSQSEQTNQLTNKPTGETKKQACADAHNVVTGSALPDVSLVLLLHIRRISSLFHVSSVQTIAVIATIKLRCSLIIRK